MPTEWKYHGDGVQTAVTTNHDLDGTLTSIRLQLDCFKVRTWTEEEYDNHPNPPITDWDDQEEVFYQHADGSHATLRFNVNDGVAVLRSIKAEDTDNGEIEPRHMPLLVSAKRILGEIDGVDHVDDPMETLLEQYDNAHGIHIDKLDA